MTSFDTPRRKASRGFTLIEMMITVAILGIILAFAIPNYQKRAMVSKRTDATSALLAIAAGQERFYLKNSAYTSNLEDLSVTKTESDLYELSLIEAANGGYKATATAKGGNSQEFDTECRSFTIDHTGKKSSTGAPDPDGGNTPDTVNCW